MRKLVFATNNKHKLTEIRQIVPDIFEILGLEDIGCFADIPETADSLKGNADIKANYVYTNYNLSCFADDTGLEVDALDGAPGVYSARYAGADGNADKNIDKLLHELSAISNRKARFKTVISLILDGIMYHFVGQVEGKIIYERTGKDGFGYDPVFMPDGFNQSFAEMPAKIKNSISHRGIATRKLIDFLGKIND